MFHEPDRSHFLVCLLGSFLLPLWWPKPFGDLGVNFSPECVALYIKLMAEVRLYLNK